MSADRVAAAFDEAAQVHGAWKTEHVIGGQRYGGGIRYDDDPRFADFLAMARPEGDLLEFGCFEGGHTVRLARLPGVRRVLAADARATLVAKTGIAARLHGLDNVGTVECNANDTARIAGLGRFDQTYCTGMVYHLREPWKFLKALSGVTRRLYISTHYADKALGEQDGYRGAGYRERPDTDDLSGTESLSFWPTLSELVRMIGDCGFDIDSLRNYPRWNALSHGVVFPLVNVQCVARG